MKNEIPPPPFREFSKFYKVSIGENMSMKKITELTAELAAPAIAQAGCTLWDVEYVKEGGVWYLPGISPNLWAVPCW